MHLPRIGILIQFKSSYGRQVLRGIADFAHTASPWRFCWDPIYAPCSLKEVPSRRVDGVIASLVSDEDVAEAKSWGIPVVNVSGRGGGGGLPRVCVNNLVIGRTGAEHFQNLGLKRALYLQPESGPGFVQRQRGFLTRCQELGVACASLEVPGRWEDGYWLDEDRLGRLRAFLEASQKPLGIMAAVDTLGVHTLSLCQELQIRVPDDAAVLGVGNDELLCDFAWPSMSSLDVNARRVGYQAAALLQQTLNGETNGLVSEETLIEPYGVVARESTDMLAVNDPVVAESVRFIRANACKGISVVDVVRQLPLARRAFERRFLRQMKRTPLQEIRRVQVEAARWMLEHTDHPVALVASRAGFRDPKYFSKAFRMETGVPPTEYRKDSEAGRDKSAYAL